MPKTLRANRGARPAASARKDSELMQATAHKHGHIWRGQYDSPRKARRNPTEDIARAMGYRS